MSDTDDFAALFEASLKAKRIDRGQTIEGTIVAMGRKWRSSTSAAKARRRSMWLS